MAYIISQMRKQSGTKTYMTPLDNLVASTITSPNIFGDTTEGSDFTDFAIAESNGAQVFEPGVVYYLRFRVCKVPQYFYSGSKDSTRVSNYQDSDLLKLQLLLKNDTDDLTTTPPLIIGNCTVPISVNFDEPEYSSYSFVFTPSKGFNRLGFRLGRVSFDAIEKEHLPESTWKRDWLLDNYAYSNITRSIGSGTRTQTIKSIPSVKIEWQGENADLCKLENIVPQGQSPWLKIGYQSRPGSLIVVNGEPIRVGRSGIYLIDNGTDIESFMIASPGGSDNSKIDAFLLDYAYKK